MSEGIPPWADEHYPEVMFRYYFEALMEDYADGAGEMAHDVLRDLQEEYVRLFGNLTERGEEDG